VNAFFADLARRWSEGASKRGAVITAPDLDAAVAEEILQLARVVAHSKERSFAPLASFMAGVAVERLRVAKGTDPAGAAAFVREVREALERESAGVDQRAG
jgi:hypothetical protein